MINLHWLQQTETDVPPQSDWLSPNESIRQQGMRFAKRRSDWRLGRWTAKWALAAYWKMPALPHFLAKIEIRAAPSGAPEVFFGDQRSSVTISLSHRVGVGLCAIAPVDVALGCDLEVIEARSDAFVADYFASRERALVAHAPADERAEFVSLLWSAKESALKALQTGLRLDTRRVRVSFPDTSEPSDADVNRLPPEQVWHPLHVDSSGGQIFDGWWQRSGDLLRTMVAAPAPAPPIVLNPSRMQWSAQRETNHETKFDSATRSSSAIRLAASYYLTTHGWEDLLR